MKRKAFSISLIVLVAASLSLTGCPNTDRTTTSATASPATPASNASIPPTATPSKPITTTGAQPATTIASAGTRAGTSTVFYSHDEAVQQAKYYQNLADDALSQANDDRDKAQRDPSMYNFYMQAYNEQMGLYNTYLQEAKDFLYIAANE
jgi:hypothetical protein